MNNLNYKQHQDNTFPRLGSRCSFPLTRQIFFIVDPYLAKSIVFSKIDLANVNSPDVILLMTYPFPWK